MIRIVTTHNVLVVKYVGIIYVKQVYYEEYDLDFIVRRIMLYYN